MLLTVGQTAGYTKCVPVLMSANAKSTSICGWLAICATIEPMVALSGMGMGMGHNIS